MLENCCKIESKYLKCSIVAVLITLSAFLAAIFLSEVVDIKEKIQTSENTITVSDTGTIYAKPDLAITTFSVITEAKTVGEAVAENTKNMNNIINSVKSQGVADKDLKTINFYIYPRYECY